MGGGVVDGLTRNKNVMLRLDVFEEGNISPDTAKVAVCASLGF